LCDVLDAPELKTDARFATNTARRENIIELQNMLNAHFTKESTNHWLSLLGQAEIPCAPIQNIEQAANDLQLAAREMIVQVQDSTAGPQRVVNSPLNFSEMDSDVRASAPQLGEHNEQVLRDWLG
jgi:crotonobetainyl-CoA:carnitine CoA-transferase CaiB-like acyl-CoA transferase